MSTTVITAVITTVIASVTAILIAFQTPPVNASETVRLVVLMILVLMFALQDWIWVCHSCASRRDTHGRDAHAVGPSWTTAAECIGRSGANQPRDKHYRRYD